MKLLTTIFVFFSFIFIPSISIADEKIHIFCSNKNQSNILEFKFKIEENDLWTDTFKKINGKFIKIGDVVGQKQSSFVLFEDKYAYLGVDFAWHLDKNTKILKPVLLSEGTIKLKQMPELLTCKLKNM
tara:strand:- start:95 stop:478 length:384 start_codon:yes stop_codon:yes gene_type:complete